MAVQISLPAAPLPSLPVTPAITRPQIAVGETLKKQQAPVPQALPLSPKSAGLLAGLGLASFYWVTSIRRLNWMALLTFLGAAGLGVTLGTYKKEASQESRSAKLSKLA